MGCKEFVFKGNAPEVIAATSSSATFENDVKIYFENAKSGWSTPKWRGYNAETIDDVQEEDIRVTKITISKTSYIMKIGDTVKLNYSIAPLNATDKNATWNSSNENIAVVDENGHVTAKKVGTTNIKVISNDGNKTAVCKVSVVESYDLSVEMADAKQWVWVDDTKEIGFTAKGRGYDEISTYIFDSEMATSEVITDKTSTYEGSGTEQRRTDVIKQKFTGKKAGTVPVAVNLGRSDEYSSETIHQKIFNLNVIDLQLSTYYSYLEPGQSFRLKNEVYPNVGIDFNVTYGSDNPTVAKVTKTGKVTAVSEGVANIVVQANNGKIMTGLI